MSKIYFAILFSSVVLSFPVSHVLAKQPAARTSDYATSLAVINGTPCVGGPILPPGATTVLIGKLPAARVTDLVGTACGPFPIVKGSVTVRIQNLPAARLGDLTADGGAILSGAPTVLIGD